MEFKYNFRLEDFQPTTRRTVEHTLASYEKQYVHFLFMSETDKLFKFREGRLRASCEGAEERKSHPYVSPRRLYCRRTSAGHRL